MNTYQSLKKLSRLLIVFVVQIIIGHGSVQHWNGRIHLAPLMSNDSLQS